MRKIIFAGIFALSASAALAQTGSPLVPTAKADPTSTGEPANLCQELLAFMKAPPPEEAATAPAKPATDRQSPPTGAQPSADDVAKDSRTKEAAAGRKIPSAETGENSAPASGKAVPPQSAEKGGSAQDVSGQSGPAHGAPEQNSASVTQGNVQNAPQTSGLSAPVPTQPTSTSKESVMDVVKAQRLADANDIAACKKATKELRLAGVAMPPPLLALAALELKYHHSGSATPQAPRSQEPAAQPKQ